MTPEVRQIPASLMHPITLSASPAVPCHSASAVFIAHPFHCRHATFFLRRQLPSAAFPAFPAFSSGCFWLFIFLFLFPSSQFPSLANRFPRHSPFTPIARPLRRLLSDTSLPTIPLLLHNPGRWRHNASSGQVQAQALVPRADDNRANDANAPCTCQHT